MSAQSEVDVAIAMQQIATAAGRVARAITPPDAVAGHDATGGSVDSLTEAVMGVTTGLVRIADAIGDLAEAVREHE